MFEFCYETVHEVVSLFHLFFLMSGTCNLHDFEDCKLRIGFPCQLVLVVSAESCSGTICTVDKSSSPLLAYGISRVLWHCIDYHNEPHTYLQAKKKWNTSTWTPWNMYYLKQYSKSKNAKTTSSTFGNESGKLLVRNTPANCETINLLDQWHKLI